METANITFWRDGKGSLTVEALLILPFILLLTVLFIRWGLMLQTDLKDMAQKLTGGISVDAGTQDEPGIGAGFLSGGLPARRIRDTDLLIDLGYSIKESLPTWFHP